MGDDDHKDEWGNCTLGSDDDSPVQCVGEWVLDKHEYVRRYIEATHGARARYLGPQKGGAAFIDLYAGPGRARIRETGTYVKGSPFLALDHTAAPFSRIILCELAEVNLVALSKRIPTNEQMRVSVIDGDCNEMIHEVVGAIPKHGLNLAFVDPYALSALSFETLRQLASVQRMDLIIHFPTGSIKRNWGRVDDGLDRFLGTKDWRKVASRAQDAGRLVDVLSEQLTTAGYTGANVRAVPIENSKHTRMYHLVFASKHALADKIWNSVTKHKPDGQRGFGW